MKRRRAFSSLIVRSLGFAAFVGLGGCQADRSKEPTGAVMLGVRTNLAIDKDLDRMLIQIEQSGGMPYSGDFTLGEARRLPATLAILRGSDPSPITVTVVGFKGSLERSRLRLITIVPEGRVDFHELSSYPQPSQHLLAVPDPGSSAGGAASDMSGLRLLPAAIDWLCTVPSSGAAAGNGVGDAGAGGASGADQADPFGCADGQTCVAGRCESSERDASQLPFYSSREFFGGSAGTSGSGGSGANGNASCFDVRACFQGSPLASAFDRTACHIDMPANSAVNVAIVMSARGDGFCDATQCYVPLDRGGASGWTEDAAGIALPPGLCDRMARSGSPVIGIATSTRCASKTEQQSPCQASSQSSGGSGGAGGNSAGTGGDVGGGRASGGASGGAAAAPSVAQTEPADGALGVEPDATINVVFSEAMAASTINADTFNVSEAGVPVPGSVAYDASSYTASWSANDRLALLTNYTVTLGAEITNQAGTALVRDVSFAFTVRDGAWSAPTTLGAATNVPVLELAGGDSGEAMLFWGGNANAAHTGHFVNEAWELSTDLPTASTAASIGALAFEDGFGALAGLSDGRQLWFYRFDSSGWNRAGNVTSALAQHLFLALQGGRAFALDQESSTTPLLKSYAYENGNFSGTGVTVASDAPPNSELLASSLAPHPTHDLVAYWSGLTNEVMAVVRTPGGAWSSAVPIAPYTNRVDGLHAFAEPSGHFVVVWEEVLDTAVLNTIWGSESDDGATWTTPIPIASSPSVTGLRVAANRRGDLLAVWQESGMPSQMQSQFRPAGGNWNPTSTPIAPGQAIPSIAIDVRGNALALFPAIAGGMQFARYSTNTRQWALSYSPISASTTPPKLAIDAAGRAHAAWLDSATPTAPPVRVARFE